MSLCNILFYSRAFRNCLLRSSDNKRFSFYCCYVFGTSLLITCLASVVDHTDVIDEQFKIGIGKEVCWVKRSTHVEFIYVYLPMGCVVLFNTIFYSFTAFNIHRVQKETSMIKGGDSARHSKVKIEKAR